MSDMGKPESFENRRRVLLADDRPLVLERVTVLLQSTFEVVGVAHDGLEMIDKAMRLSPDIIVSDISMPKLDGIQAAHRIQKLGAKAPIVFLTIHESPRLGGMSGRRRAWICAEGSDEARSDPCHSRGIIGSVLCIFPPPRQR